ncbi:hypothetical protein CC1G_14329 [Coprinopsis cinerea okayama7|uniref:Uncharacterized protein n=1 Tax=Coprinopsis cinerea (strain Okayama-7 / 130 / ATCC MYA-4618 / FGSC 9003) TaxID=240176 RepID=D6RM64_COPC7|nr:hypothetical protein CC1G_14329 [Coprinopsis cinerea okayama7\|eukprot:XP_002911333.1 hypothetical protein CC1G_14329 [Coprinopsis cinerea okayama7\
MTHLSSCLYPILASSASSLSTVRTSTVGFLSFAMGSNTMYNQSNSLPEGCFLQFIQECVTSKE